MHVVWSEEQYECMERIKLHVIPQSWKTDTFTYSCHRYAEFLQLLFSLTIMSDKVELFKIGLE